MGWFSDSSYNSTDSSLNIASLARLLDFFVCVLILLSIHVHTRGLFNYIILCNTITSNYILVVTLDL